jgi:branched-chain amino acid transport system ATP-binding protein
MSILRSAGEAITSTEEDAEPPVLEVRDIEQRFGGLIALRGVGLDVRAGEIHGLIGPNGAGKTTLFDCIAGVRPPRAGTVMLRGVDITRSSAVRRARLGVRRTFQRQQIFGWLTVEDNVVLALEWRGGGGGLFGDALRFSGRYRRERSRREVVEQVLDSCGLLAIREESAGALSIGELRRVELARAIVDAPSLLLLDEPTSGLADGEIAQLGVILSELRAAGTAILLVEHHLPFVMERCDRISVLDLGEVISSGIPSEVVKEEAVREAYLT